MKGHFEIIFLSEITNCWPPGLQQYNVSFTNYFLPSLGPHSFFMAQITF